MFSNRSLCLFPSLCSTIYSLFLSLSPSHIHTLSPSLPSSLPLCHLFGIAFIFLSFSTVHVISRVFSSFCSDYVILPFVLFQPCSSSSNPSALLNFALRPSSHMQLRSTTVIVLERDQLRIVYDPVNFPAELLFERNLEERRRR